ncbi:uncharacterized protein LOC129593945 isoform X4 [Paramacrobiotus metropolitanus]|uniref:uncharacterized protein LOC129593945 isoform X4 n=1 Tax=Paramacrobiotus metropolitanus TaxID=2943436 RepID=UPI002445D336|nr:uncharacterized protein LOC129593945 isoform X4 [Paramacrobiotus metropolitanus]XP_055346442.1 uncharacterized protein LOC129593945 isoform X4 [Paramacrobiotus metropolitanus]
METNKFPLHPHNIAINTSDKYRDIWPQPRYLYPGSGKLDVREMPVNSTSIVKAKTYLDINYIKTFSGILKIIELVLILTAVILAAAAWSIRYSYRPFWHWWRQCTHIECRMEFPIHCECLNIVTSTGFLITLILLFLYFSRLIKPERHVGWLFVEAIYCGIVAVLLCTAGAFMIPYTDIDNVQGVCTAFYWLAMCAYGADAFFKFKSWRTGQAAPGMIEKLPWTETPIIVTGVQPYFDIHYLKTLPGILKIIELVCTAIAFVLGVTTWSSQ